MWSTATAIDPLWQGFLSNVHPANMTMTDAVVVPLKSGREARSRKSKATSSGNGSALVGNDITLGNGSDHSGRSGVRSDREAMRKRRVRRAKARKSRGQGAALCCIAGAMFVLYLAVCLVFFRNLPGEEGRGMRGLVKKTKERMAKFRGKRSEQESDVDRRPKVVGGDADIMNGAEEAAAAPKSAVPVGTWPISIRDEDGKFEDIDHPGFDAAHPVRMSVPSFWADDPVAIHENKLMSRERAMSIGTCATPDPATGSSVRGDECPLDARTIFVAIASYRDWQCRDTVTSIFSAATHPERIRVAVVDQIVAGEDGSCDVPVSAFV